MLTTHFTAPSHSYPILCALVLFLGLIIPISTDCPLNRHSSSFNGRPTLASAPWLLHAQLSTRLWRTSQYPVHHRSAVAHASRAVGFCFVSDPSCFLPLLNEVDADPPLPTLSLELDAVP